MTRFCSLIAGLALLSVRTGTAQTTPPPGARPAPQIDCSKLTVDSASKTATLELVAALTDNTGGLNFNGFRDGGLTFTVPLNWNVVVHFKNNDHNLMHSAEIIDSVKALPPGPVEPPAFPRAMTIKLMQGLSASEADQMKFVANKVGSYMIWCAVPGHGLAGMWIRFKVSATEKKPSLVATST
jgi:hypothetical protein